MATKVNDINVTMVILAELKTNVKLRYKSKVR